MKKVLKHTGWLAIITFFGMTFIASRYNPGFSIYTGAFSDLGSIKATQPYIFNYSLIFIITPLILLFSIYLIDKSENKIQTVGASFILTASFFIAFIGIFPEGTKYHNFVALYFFIQYFLGILIYGLGSKNKPFKYLCIGLFITFWILLITMPFPSIAIAETTALLLILVFNIASIIY